MADNERRYVVNGVRYKIPEAEVENFLKANPGAVPVNTYTHQDSTYHVPINDLDGFLADKPDAKLVDGSKKKGSSQKSGTKEEVSPGGLTQKSQSPPDGFRTLFEKGAPTKDAGGIDRFYAEPRTQEQIARGEAGEPFGDELPGPQTSFEYVLQAGGTQSILSKGILYLTFMEEATRLGKKDPLDYAAGKLREFSQKNNLNLAQYEPSKLDDVAASVFGLALDSGVFAGMGGISKGALKAGGWVKNQLVKRGVSKVAADKAAKGAVRRHLARGAAESGLTLGQYQAAANTLQQLETAGTIEDFEAMQVLGEFGKGGLLGAGVGVLGASAGIINNSIMSRGIRNQLGKKAATAGVMGAATIAEGGLFELGGALMEGRAPTVDGWVHNALVFGTMKMAGVPSKFKEGRPDVVDYTTSELRDLGGEGMIGKTRDQIIKGIAKDVKKYEEVMNNPDIPWSTKAKVAYEINGIPPINPPEVIGYNMRSVPDGRTIVETTDSNGAIVERSYYNTKGEAMRDVADVDASIKEGAEIKRFYDADGEAFNVVDSGLREAGYENGVESEALTSALKINRSQRTPEQQKAVDDWMDIMGEAKIEAPVKEEAAKPKDKVEELKEKKVKERQESLDLLDQIEKEGGASGVTESLSNIEAKAIELRREGKTAESSKLQGILDRAAKDPYIQAYGERISQRSIKDIRDDIPKAEKAEPGKAEKPERVEPTEVEKLNSEISRLTKIAESDRATGLIEQAESLENYIETLKQKRDAIQKPSIKDVGDGKVKSVKTTINDVEVSLSNAGDKAVHIDRFFMPEEGRGKGESYKVLDDLVKQADKDGIELTTTISPDVPTDANYKAMQSFFKKAGFEPEVRDGEIYRNELTRKPKGDAIQKPKAEKVDVGEPAEPGKEVGRKREVAEEAVTHVTSESSEKYADLTETPEGDYVFFHYSPERRTVIDPKKSGTNKGAITTAAEQGAAGTAGGLSYYYPNTSKVEPGVGKEQHTVRVPKEKVYDGNKDPLNLAEEAKKRFKEKHPDMGFSPNHKMAWITKLAGEKGFDIVLVDWAGGTRAQSTKALKPEAKAPEYTRTSEKGYKKQPPVKAEDTYMDVLDKINKHQDGKGVYDELYHARNAYMNPKNELYQNKKAITDLVEKSDLPKELKDQYKEALEAKDVPGVAVKDPVVEQVGTHQREGGSTYTVDGKNLMGQDKTAVGLFPERTERIKGDLKPEDIEAFKEKNKDILDGNEDVLSIGTWHKKETGEHVLDITATTSREKAIELGKKYNQESVFDLGKGEEISTGGTGKIPEGVKAESERIADLKGEAAPPKEPPKPPKPPKEPPTEGEPMELPSGDQVPGTGKKLTDKEFRKEMKAAQKEFDKAVREENKDALNSYRNKVIERRIALNQGAYETNLFVDGINKATTKNERIAATLLLEKRGVPEEYKGTKVEELYNNPTDAVKETVKESRKYFDEAWENIVENTDKMSVDQIENYVTHIWDIPKNMVEGVGQWFSTRNKYLNKRSIETIKEGMDKFGIQPKTLDIGEIIKIHSAAARNAIENSKFVEDAKKIDVGGFPLLAKAKDAPPGWVKYEHPALSYKTIVGKDSQGRPVRIKDYYSIPKELKPSFDALFGSTKVGDARLAELWNVYDSIGNYLKKTQLSLSLFHHGALSETAIANMGLPKAMKVILYDIGWKGSTKKGVPAFQNPDAARRSIEYGVQLGAAQDFDVAKIQRQLDNLAEATKGTPLQPATWGLKEFNRAWDRALWEYLHDGLKIYTFEHMAGKVNKNKLTPEQYERQMRETAQFVNDSFGGQNFDVLGISPMQQRLARAFLLSPDWTISTIRQALAPTGVGTLYKNDNFWKLMDKKSPASARRKHGAMFWVKAAMWYGTGINILNAVARKKDMEENPELYTEDQLAVLERSIKDVDLSNKKEVQAYLKDLSQLTMVNNTVGHKTHLFDGRYEDGKERYIRWGKQFRELPELFMDESGVNFPKPMLKKMGGKMSPQMQILSQMFTGKTASGYENYDMKNKNGWEYTMGIMKTLVKSALPFSTANMIREDKQWRFMDLMMPASKGMSAYKAEQLFFRGIEAQAPQYVSEVYEGAVRNNLDAYSLFESAMNRHERTLEVEASDLGSDMDKLREMKAKETDPKKRNEIATRILEVKTKKLEIEAARLSMKQAMDLMKLYTEQYDKKWKKKPISGEAKKDNEQKQ